MRSTPPRTGSISAWLLFSIPVLLMLGFLGINALMINLARGQTQNVADASALAAGYSLVDDAMLLGDPALADLEDVAKVQAQGYSNFNPVPPLPIPYADTDFTFTQTDHPLNSSLKVIDTLELTARRTADNNNPVPLFGQQLFSIASVNVTAKAKVRLDRNVVGFRPVFLNNIPVVPIAIAETDMGTMTSSAWKEQIEDQWASMPPGSVNAFPTITVTIGNMGQYDPYVLHLMAGADPAAETENGIPPSDLDDQGGQLIVANGGSLAIPGSRSVPADLAAALQTLQTNGTKRAFPLFDGLDMMGQPLVTRFVAAKVTNVMDGGSTITLTLTPTLMEHPSVVTDVNQSANAYLARVRLSFP